MLTQNLDNILISDPLFGISIGHVGNTTRTGISDRQYWVAT